MIFDPPLIKATLLKRYRRFLTDIETNSGEILTIHCPNTGSMMNCIVDNSPAWYQPSTDPNRKTKGTWVIATTPFDRLANVNTHLANGLVEEALESGLINLGNPYVKLQREVKYGCENSRIDLRLTHEDQTYTYPDAVTARGTKHLRELTELVNNGTQAVLIYCVNLEAIEGIRPADEIDPVYGKALREAIKAGVKVLAYGVSISASEIKITHSLPVIV